MNKKSHNKKRNVGIIYEQLILTISRAVVENNLTVVEQAKSIIKKYFKPGTELYKEHKLFQALIKPQIDDPSLATSILGEAKKASRAHDYGRLEREKSKMIRDINLNFGKNFYNTKIKEYKDYATVQTLLNDWRFETKDFARLVEYEKKVHSILTRSKNVATLAEQKTPAVNNLVVKIMTDKFNARYGQRLTELQQNLIKQYVFADQNNGLKFQIQIDAQAKSEPVETQLANSFTQVADTGTGDPANIFTTSALFGNQDRNFSHALHSIAIYPNAYTGNITIQGSCIENTPNSDDASTDWFDVESNISLSASSSIYHKTFTLNANWLRILHTPTSGSIDKILVRN